MFLLVLSRCLRPKFSLLLRHLSHTHLLSAESPFQSWTPVLQKGWTGVSLPLLDLQQMNKYECVPVACKSYVSFNIHDCLKSQNSANLELMLNLRDAVAYGKAHYNCWVSFVSIFAKGLVLLFREFYKQLYDILQVAF